MGKVNYDAWGHCVISGVPLYKETVIDGEIVKVPTSEMTHATYLLDDGSLMRVCISRQSKKSLSNTEVERKFIMDKVKEGWKKETDALVKDENKKEWTKERQKDYLDKYTKKDIVDRIDDIPYRSLSNVEREVNKVKKRLLKEARRGNNYKE